MFQTSEIQFHTDENHILYKHTDLNQNIGILQLQVKKTDILKQPIYILFSVDCSASMSETTNNSHNHPFNLNTPRPRIPDILESGPDRFLGNHAQSNNHTKMYQLIYTLKRIFKELAKESEKTGVEINVAVMGFEHKLHSIVEFIQITQENVDILINLLDTIESKTSTNIEIALKYAKKTLSTYLKSKNNRVYHVFMTDGQITSGETNSTNLKKYIDTRYSTTFVGFGKQHDSSLLIELSNYLLGEYYFIDKIENSGLVYGEIVYNIIYLAIDAIILSIRNGLMYDWKTNMWVSDIKLANISNDCEKILHLMTYGFLFDVEIDVCSITQNGVIDTIIDTLYCYPPLLNIEHSLDISMDPVSISKLDTENKGIEPVDLSKYHFRQKTQELMFETRKIMEDFHIQYNTTNNNNDRDIDSDSDSELKIDTNIHFTERNRLHKCKLQEFLKDMLEFMKKSMLTEDMFMRRLGDDIYVLYNTFDRVDAQMWCTSRQVSQGRQQTYTASQFESDDNVDIYRNNQHPRLGRQQTFWEELPQSQITINNIWSNDHKSNDSAKTQDLWENTCKCSVNDDDDDTTANVDFWNDYRIGQDGLDLSNATPNMVNMMMSISQDYP
jgi:Mg-chelatase subunit ChlD